MSLSFKVLLLVILIPLMGRAEEKRGYPHIIEPDIVGADTSERVVNRDSLYRGAHEHSFKKSDYLIMKGKKCEGTMNYSPVGHCIESIPVEICSCGIIRLKEGK